MKQYTLHIPPETGSISPLHDRVLESDRLDAQAYRTLNLLHDGSVTAVYEMTGEAAYLEELLRDAAFVHAYQVFNPDGESFNLYLHFDPEPFGQGLLELVEAHGLIVETPIPYATDGALVVTIAGPESAIEAAAAELDAATGIDAGPLDEYHPSVREFGGVLTDRQREILLEAIERGYYQIPRKVTRQELADTFDCSPATVGEHLRKAEARILSDGFPESA